MNDIFHNTTTALEGLFHKLETKIDAPCRKPYADNFVYRYEESTLEVALTQKLARVITGLRACLLLLTAGYFQEMAALQRVIDDLDEEIFFLVNGKLTDTWGVTHEKFLSAFYTEPFINPSDPNTALDVKRKPVSRKDIRTAVDISIEVMRDRGFPIDVNFIKNQRIVSSVFNGFVHAGSPQILELYGGDPPHYYLNGMLGTTREQESVYNQFYRGALSTSIICLYLQEPELAEIANIAAKNLEDNKYW